MTPPTKQKAIATKGQHPPEKRPKPGKGKGTDAPTGPESNYPKPTILTSNRQLDQLAHEAITAIVSYNRAYPCQPVIYVRGGLLTYLCRDEDGNIIARPVTPTVLKRILADVASWTKLVKNDGEWREVSAAPSEGVISYILGMEEWKDFPALAGISYGPVFGPDGTLHESAGYSRATQMYNASVVKLGDMEPTPANVAAAKELILENLFVDFPFKDKASKTHAMALLLLPFIRPMIRRVTPLHLVDAPDAGTGKGLLVDLCGIVATGRSLPATQATTDDEEWRKKITTALLSGTPHVFFDNIPLGYDLDSGALASALTQEHYKDRILKNSADLYIKVRCVWVASGNNVSPSREMARRSIWIRLDANTESPYERSNFKHKEIRTWAETNREVLATAVVILIRSWIEAGRPMYEGKLLGSYEEWTKVMGGLLDHIGMTDFLANCAELFETAVSGHAVFKDFVEEWHSQHKERETTTSELFKIASHSDDTSDSTQEWLDILGDQLGSGKQQSRLIKLGNMLADYKDRVVGSFKIQQGTKVKGKPRWRLMRVDG